MESVGSNAGSDIAVVGLNGVECVVFADRHEPTDKPLSREGIESEFREDSAGLWVENVDEGCNGGFIKSSLAFTLIFRGLEKFSAYGVEYVDRPVGVTGLWPLSNFRSLAASDGV